jgi:hypothetical protein
MALVDVEAENGIPEFEHAAKIFSLAARLMLQRVCACIISASALGHFESCGTPRVTSVSNRYFQQQFQELKAVLFFLSSLSISPTTRIHKGSH